MSQQAVKRLWKALWKFQKIPMENGILTGWPEPGSKKIIEFKCVSSSGSKIIKTCQMSCKGTGISTT